MTHHQSLKKDIAKLDSSQELLYFIDTLLENVVQTKSDNAQEFPNSSSPNRKLACGTVVKDVPNLYEIVSKSLLSKVSKSHDIIVRMNQLKNANVFNIKNERARHFLGIAMAYVPSISNQSAALFIACIIASFCVEIGFLFDPKDMACIAPTRNTLSNIIEECSVTSMIDVQRMIMRPGTKVFMASDHGNKKGLHHLVKVMLLWSEKEK